MKYYVQRDEETHRIRALYENKELDSLIEVEAPDGFDPMTNGAFYYVKNVIKDTNGNYYGQLLQMPIEEYKALNPLYDKPVLNETQILQAKVQVLSERNKSLEKCVMELSNLLLNDLEEQDG